MLQWSAKPKAHETRSVSSRVFSLALAASLSACAYGHGSNDIDHTPVANAGAGASIIYPGRGAPTFHTGGQYGPRGGVIGTGQPTESGGAGAPRSAAGSGGGAYRQSGSGSPGGTNGGSVSFLGGSEQDEVSHESYKNEPYFVKYLALPFAMVAAPFMAAYDTARGEPEPGPELPRATLQRSRLPEPTSPRQPNDELASSRTGRNPAPAPTRASSGSRARDYESIQLQKMERELDRRVATRPAPHHTASPTSSPVFSIADELAALQRTAPAPRGTRIPSVSTAPGPQYASLEPTAPRQRASVPTRTTPAVADSPFAKSVLGSADGIVDRNGDGRIDHWLYRDNGRLAREVLDDDFDGQGERTIHYDIASNQVTRVEEDFDHDSLVDSWTDYSDGRVTRRRSDLDHDGAVDSWTYYRDGEISRHERDTTGDGFRDRVGFYRRGVLDFEEQDHDGDGRADVTVRYDANEQIVGREEDLNGDGGVDLISHYENGKLTSREVLDPSALGSGSAPRR